MTLKIRNASDKKFTEMETPYDSLEKAAKGQTKPSILTKIKKLWK